MKTNIIFFVTVTILLGLIWGFFGLAGIGVTILAVCLLELLLRENQKQFFQENTVNVKKIPKLLLDRQYEFDDPDVKINWDHDEELGWKLDANKELGINIAIKELGLNRRFSYRTDENGCRRTSSESAADKSGQKTVSVLGCSITYGHSLKDEETYAWLLQEKYPEKRVVNYAVAGYSLYQSLLVLEKTIDKDKPEVVVMGFHPDLGWRNTNAYDWVSLIQQTWRIPSCVYKKGALQRFAPDGWRSLPLSKVRIVKLLELYLNRIIFRGRGGRKVIQKTMEQLLLEMKALCESKGAKLVVACIDEAKDYYDFLEDNKFFWCPTGINTDELTPDGQYKWILYPFDNHPNPEANRKYADAISGTIDKVLTGAYHSPDLSILKSEAATKDKESYVYPLY